MTFCFTNGACNEDLSQNPRAARREHQSSDTAVLTALVNGERAEFAQQAGIWRITKHSDKPMRRADHHFES